MPKRSPLRTGLFGGLVLVVAACLVVAPKPALEASLRGLTIWWDIVFPALLPFLIVSEVLVAFGLAHFCGVLLEPFMRPLFNVPGTGALVLTMGFSSGYPVCAKMATRLAEEGLLTRSEAERLIAFATTADPLFIGGAVAVGFLHHPAAAGFLAAVHYGTALLIGVGLRFYDRHGARTVYRPPQGGWLLLRALRAMHCAREADRRPLGQVLGDAVWSSLQTLLMIGGYIILFSVLLDLLTRSGGAALLSAALALVLSPLGVPADLLPGFVAGTFEVTMGTRIASEAMATVSTPAVLASVSALLAWGGLSIHAQVASIVSRMGLRLKPYLLARLVHAALSWGVAWWASAHWLPHDLPAWTSIVPWVPQSGHLAGEWLQWGKATLLFVLTLLLLSLAAFVGSRPFRRLRRR